MECPICKTKIHGWRNLGSLSMIAQCPNNPKHFYFPSDLSRGKPLFEIISEREERVANEILNAVALLEEKGFHIESEFHFIDDFIDEKDGLDIIFMKMGFVNDSRRQLELLRKYMLTSLVISKEANNDTRTKS